MKGLVLLFLILLFGALTRAQIPIGIVCDSITGQENYRDWNPCRVVYYIEGIKTIYTNDLGKLLIKTEGIYTIKYQQLIDWPQRNINAIAGTIAGVDSRAGQVPNIRGARQDGTAYYIDGVRIHELEMP